MKAYEGESSWSPLPSWNENSHYLTKRHGRFLQLTLCGILSNSPDENRWKTLALDDSHSPSLPFSHSSFFSLRKSLILALLCCLNSVKFNNENVVHLIKWVSQCGYVVIVIKCKIKESRVSDNHPLSMKLKTRKVLINLYLEQWGNHLLLLILFWLLYWFTFFSLSSTDYYTICFKKMRLAIC